MPSTTPNENSERPTRKRKTFRAYLLVASLAAAVRLLYLHGWLGSPFRYYHTLFGLDMRELLVKGVTFQHGEAPFSAHAAFLALIHSISGDALFVLLNATTQMILGIATALMTVYIFRRVFGGVRAACCAGILCALYLPMTAYEAHILKATLFVFLPTASLALLLAARRRAFRGAGGGVRAFAAGAVAATPFLVRTSGLAWLAVFHLWLILYFLRKRAKKDAWKILALPAAGTVAVVAAVMAFNASKGFDNEYLVNPNYKYILGAGALPDSATLSPGNETIAANTVGKTDIATRAVWYLEKTVSIFVGRTVPNNINIDFIRSKLPAARLMITPAFLVPMAAGGLLALLAAGLARRRASILFLYLAAFAIPMTLFFPLERYRLTLTPVFCVAAAWWGRSLVAAWRQDEAKNPKQKNAAATWRLLLPVFGCAASLAATLLTPPVFRNSDEQAYGIAACTFPDMLMRKGHFAEAAKILFKRHATAPENSIISLNLASALLGTGRIDDAENLLHSLNDIENPPLEGRRQYEMGEAAFIKGDLERAAMYYAKCLELPVATRRKKMALSRLRMCHRKH